MTQDEKDEIVRVARETGLIQYVQIEKTCVSNALERFAAIVAEPWIETNKALAKEIIELKKQAEQEPVAKEVLKYCTYFKCIDFEQTPPFLRYDTLGSMAKENFDEYCTIQECLREYGYELTDSDVDHDTVCGDVTPMPRAAPVSIAKQSETDSSSSLMRTTIRTKDLTDGDLRICFKSTNTSEPLAEGWHGLERFARAVIAADREKNK